jgi:hypothetical protein
MTMDSSTLIFLIIGVPLILVALGLALLCLRFFLTRNNRLDASKLLAACQRLDSGFDRLEARITALEDILLGGAGPRDETVDAKVRDFDAKLDQS